MVPAVNVSAEVCKSQEENTLARWLEGKTAKEVYRLQLDELFANQSHFAYTPEDRGKIIEVLEKDFQESNNFFTFCRRIFSKIFSSSKKSQGRAPSLPVEIDRPLRGLPNNGNDCFLNALFQVILTGDPEIQRDLSEQYPEIRDLLQAYREGRPVSTRVLRPLLAKLSERGDVWRRGQHDPHEALARLLGGIGDQETRRITRRDSCRLPFEGYRLIEGGEENEPYERSGFQVYMPAEYLNQARSEKKQLCLKQLLDLSFDSRDEVEMNRMCECSESGAQVSLPVVAERKKMRLSRPLDYWTLQIARFQPEKISDSIDVPERLQIEGRYFSSAEDLEYELEGFIEHIGSSCRSGHYVGYVSRRDQEGRKHYYRCNDSYVEEISQAKFLLCARTAYMLHYRKV